MAIRGFLLRLHPIPDRPVQPLQWYFPLCFATVVVASALRNRKARLLITIPILALFTRFHSSYAGVPKVDYPLSLWLMWIFVRYIDISLLGPDDKMWRLEKLKKLSSNTKTKRAHLRDGNFAIRLKRSLSLWTTLRGIGWNWEIKFLKTHQGSRISFLFSTFLKTVSAKVLQDIVFYVRRRLPYSGPIPRIDLSQGPISHQLALSWLPVIHIFSELTYLYGLGALVCVGLQIHNPSDWPELFGDLSEAYTVGQAWSRAWHQTLRRVCTFLVAPLTEYLGVPERTSLHRNITLIVGFTISGIIHYAGTCNLPYSPSHERYFLFFVVQPLAIMFEDAVLAVGRGLGIKPSRNWKILGYIWMVVWITLSVRVFFLRTSLEDLYPVSDPEFIDRVARYFFKGRFKRLTH